MIFKSNYPSLKFQHCIFRYLGSRTRLRTKKSSTGGIFDDQQNDQKKFKISKIQIISELSLTPANLNILGYQMVGGNCVEIDVCKHAKCSHECINIGPCQNVT